MGLEGGGGRVATLGDKYCLPGKTGLESFSGNLKEVRGTGRIKNFS